MPKSEINKLSKRQILESLYYEQSQSTATLSRFFTAIARHQGISPEDLAKAFSADEDNHQYVEKFNQALREIQMKKAMPAEEAKAETDNSNESQQ
jgi:prolyl-tRNA editing enzyme YbaK/EbsC (Cys-tRNA(Pro) deacylase)